MCIRDSDKAAAGVELAGDEYIDPADGLIHCKKCGGQRQTVVPVSYTHLDVYKRQEMTTRLYLIAALPVALAHATPTQARRVHAYYIAGIKQPEISRIEGVHSSKVSVSIRRGLRNICLLYTSRCV